MIAVRAYVGGVVVREARALRVHVTPTWPVTTRRTVRVTRAFIGGAAAQYVTRFAGATHELDYYTAARGYAPRRVGRP